MFHPFDVGRRNSSVQVSLYVLLYLVILWLDITGYVQVVVVLLSLYLGPWHHSAVVRNILLAFPCIHDAFDVLLPKTVLGGILHIAVLSVYEEYTLAAVPVLFVDDDDGCRNTRSEEYVWRQSDDALDVTFHDQVLTNFILGVPAEEHSMRQDAGSTSLVGFHGGYEVEQECIVAAFGWRKQFTGPSVVLVILHSGGEPVLHREWWIGYAHIECAEHTALFELRVIQRVTHLYFSVAHTMEKHVELRQNGCAVILLLSANGHTSIAGFRQSSEKEGTRSTGRVVYGLLRPGEFINAQHLRNHTAHLGRSVELSLALSTLGGKILHQILVCVAKEIVIGSPVSGEIERIILEHAY